MKAILGYKIGMTQIFDKAGRRVGVTLISAKPNTVTTANKQPALIQTTAGKLTKSLSYLAKTHNTDKNIWLKQFTNLEHIDGQSTVALFTEGETVSISGVTKGKGFAGTIKRHNFHRGPVSHGSNNIRQPGSIGNQQPQRVVKGTKMSGHMGNRHLTVHGNKIIAIYPDKHLIAVSGSVPGAKRSKVIVRTDG